MEEKRRDVKERKKEKGGGEKRGEEGKLETGSNRE